MSRFSTILVILLALYLLIWLVSTILTFLVKDKRTKAVEMEANAIYLLYREVNRLNYMINLYNRTKNTEQEEPK